MPGSTTYFTATTSEEVTAKSQQNMMGTRQPPPVAPRTTSISIQPWQPTTSNDDSRYGDERYARSASTDSLESSGSSSSGGGSTNRIADVTTVEFIPTRTVGKTPKLPSHNPLQFVKVHSPLYKKAEQQIKVTKEVKITREALKEGEEEWQSNLDNWKSRRRKVSEKVIQRAEEMRQIEAEEQLRQDQILLQQKKIKKFSEIVEKKSARSYNLDLYIGQGDDSGLGGTPEPDDMLDCQSSLLRSDTSEGMTSEAESVDSDINKSDKISVKNPPKVPQKPYSRLKKVPSISYDSNQTNSNELFQHCIISQDLSISDNNSSTEPSDVEGHAADTEATSSEEDAAFPGQIGNIDSGLESLCDNKTLIGSVSDLSQDGNMDLEKRCERRHLDLAFDETAEKNKTTDLNNQSFRICVKPGDSRGFGFTLKGGKDQGCPAYIENVIKGGPADEIGLKDGDKILSLNEELTADYSHASLIFSIKQAMYTGLLDIIISRSPNYGNVNIGLKNKDSKKGNSFADKLALFSSGVTANTEESKSNAKLVEAKRESLVLRRRSAFENGKTENINAVNRRSSCVSQTSTSSSERVLEKRHSVDFALSQNAAHENNLNKKGPPPPVPVKPKIKSKPTFFELNKPASNKMNGSNENVLLPENSVNDTDDQFLKSDKTYCNTSSSSGVFKNGQSKPNPKLKFTKQDNPIEMNQINLEDNFVLDESSLNESSLYQTNHINREIYQEEQTFEKYNTSYVTVTNTVGEDINSFNVYETDDQLKDLPNENQTVSELIHETSDKFCNKIEIFETVTADNLFQEADEIKSVNDTCTEESYRDVKFLSSMHFDEKLATECAIGFETDIATDNYVVDEFVTENDLDSSFDASACHLTCNIEDTLKESLVTPYTNLQTTDEFDVTDVKNNVQINPSPLCLSLEKIDEDDVQISASTTTSSDTPDTETVIETLPSNLSPLPNDESNGEDSSKLLNCQDEESDQPVETLITNERSSNEINCENEMIKYLEGININDSEDPEVPEDAVGSPCHDMFSDDANDSVFEKTFYDQQDDEYARELDESLDQITSLDIIDRIEQSLMDQLQMDNAYEDISANLTSQLETDINSPWLYFSEESELLDDLTPRNLEPPSDPPPPPPPPEAENKGMSMSCTNSTKRLKKELWRRRSDFLGLDSPEGIDVDNIPPPPPGLEELLKQEREQSQWFEKQLLLPDPPVPITSYLSETVCSNNHDYSEYYEEENIDSSKEMTMIPEHEQWKECIDEEATFESTCDLIFDPVEEEIRAVIEESHVKTNESPQHKAKQNIQSLGAAPKAKIIDSAKWITDKVDPVSKKLVEPIPRQTTYNQNYWLAQDDERRRSMQYVDSHSERRYSMPPVYANTHADVTIRTWGDREYEYQQNRPRSAVYERSGTVNNMYDQYISTEKKDLQRTQSLDCHREKDFDTDTLESEVHKCSCCGKGLCEGSAMGIEALQLYFHIECFQCSLCHMQLGNGSCGTDVQVKNNQLYCPSCFTVD